MSVAVRTPVALAAAGVLALAPAVIASAAPGGAPLPAVHLSDVQLTGIGQDIYYAITPSVQYAVGGVSYLINFIPLLGGPTAAQININYFQGIQPVIEATVNYLAAVVQDPFNLLPATGAYGDQIYGIGYNWLDAELRFFGLPQLPPLPPAAGSVTAPRRAAVQRSGDAPAVVALTQAPDAVATTVTAAEAPAAVSVPAAKPRERVRAPRSAPARHQPRAAAASLSETADSAAPKRTSARAARAGA